MEIVQPETVDSVDGFLKAATRENTQRSYAEALRHYQKAYKGFLPATPDSVAQYLAQYANELAVSTLRGRLAALANWHVSYGFADPTKSPLVKGVMKGIKAKKSARVKQAKPIPMEVVEGVHQHLMLEAQEAVASNNRYALLRALRDNSLLLLGFWRGFRGDELLNLRIENVKVYPGRGMELFLQHTKTDKDNSGQVFHAPMLKTLCPVQAYMNWIDVSMLTEGAVYRAVNQWGGLNAERIHTKSLGRLLKGMFERAGVPDAQEFTTHSLRRGFATWAKESGWDVATLMAHVGWKSASSAMRYIENQDPYGKDRIESALDKHKSATAGLLPSTNFSNPRQLQASNWNVPKREIA